MTRLLILFGVALFAAFAGFTAICFSMKRHQRDLWKQPLPRRSVLALRYGGSLLLALSWAACAAVWGAGMGSVAWVCSVGLVPIALVFPLAYAPWRCVYAGGFAGVLSVCLSVVAFALQ
jgi:hypothetical protein